MREPNKRRGIHADTFLPEDALTRLNGLEKDARVEAWGLLHRFSNSDWRLQMISALDNFQCIRSRVVYGDQVMFIRRALFERLGGFPEVQILEDVAFCRKLLSVTTPVLLSPPAVTDARKFIKMGIWRSFARLS